MKKYIHYLKNRYIITFLCFFVWMLFFDRNDLISQYSYRAKLKKLETEKQYFISEISKIKQDMQELRSNPKSLEKFAREKYLMKKDNEEIFVFVENKSE